MIHYISRQYIKISSYNVKIVY